MTHKFATLLVISIVFQIAYINALKCYSCDSSNDPNCINDLTKVATTDCDKFCQTSIDGKGNVIRSCSEACSPGSKCQANQNEKGNNHNVCQACSSSTDPQCAQNGNVVVAFTQVCAKDNKCIVNIKDRNTERGCATDDEAKACTNPDTCKTCTGGNCNVGIFPTNRLYCYQCSENDSKCANVVANSADMKPLPCQYYDAKDECYTFGTNPSSMIRGCVSDSTEKGNKCSVPASNERCVTCSIGNCNNQNYMRNQGLKCLQCDSKTNGDACKWGMNSKEAKDCQKQIIYNQEEACYTNAKDGVVYRGCFHDSDLTKCEGECSYCKKEDGDGCNNKDKADFTCIICRSDNDRQCYKDANKINGSACRNAVSYEKRGCFAGKWNGVVIRGCLIDTDEQMNATCFENKATKCKHCMEKDCNKMEIGAASSLKAFATLFLICIALLVHKF